MLQGGSRPLLWLHCLWYSPSLLIFARGAAGEAYPLPPLHSHERDAFGRAGLRPSLLEEETKPAMKLHHVIEAQQFNTPVLLQLFHTALEMENVVAHGGTPGISEAHHGHAFLRTLHPHALLL
jgi:hypothetical protein